VSGLQVFGPGSVVPVQGLEDFERVHGRVLSVRTTGGGNPRLTDRVMSVA
jgi:hypothetical protein